MDVPNETIMDNAIADRLRPERFTNIRDVFISVHLFEPKFPIGWFSFSFLLLFEHCQEADGCTRLLRSLLQSLPDQFDLVRPPDLVGPNGDRPLETAKIKLG
jgi:hypothetical protein